MTNALLMLTMVGVWGACGKEIVVVKEDTDDGIHAEYEAYRSETNKRFIKHGYYRKYHPNKSYKSEGNYKDGDRDGPWVHYYENGQIRKREYYKAQGNDSK